MPQATGFRGDPRGARRNSAAIRLLRLARQLDGRADVPPLARLAHDYGVCTRTIRRDLAALAAAGWPVPPWGRDAGDAEDGG